MSDQQRLQFETPEKQYSPSRVIERAAHDGTTRFRLTERKVDRDGDVVEPGGGRLDNFKANPIVLFAHGWSRQEMIPIGRVLPETIKQTVRFIDANVMFDDGGSDPFSARIGEKVQGGFVNAGSIGFLPTAVSQDTVLAGQRGVTFTEWELLEFSIVPIPSLAGATARREFETFATKCAEYGQPLGDDLMSLINRHMDLHGGILKALGDIPDPTERGMLDILDKLQADMHLVKKVLEHPAKDDSDLGSDKQVVPTYDLELITMQIALAEQDLRLAHV